MRPGPESVGGVTCRNRRSGHRAAGGQRAAVDECNLATRCFRVIRAEMTLFALGRDSLHVMAGLVPAIPVFSCLGHPNVDAPHKAGPQDGGVEPSAIKFDLDFIPNMYFYPAASSVEGVVDRDDRRRDRVGCPTTTSRWSVGRRRASQEAVRLAPDAQTAPALSGLRGSLAKIPGRLPALHSPHGEEGKQGDGRAGSPKNQAPARRTMSKMNHV